MPFIIRILPEDVDLWEEIDHGARWNYRLRQRVWRPEFENIKVSSPVRLDMLVDKDMFCFVNVEDGHMSENTGARRRTHFSLKELNRDIVEPARRLRLAIESVDTSKAPPRVILREWKK